MKKPLWRDGWLIAICIGRIFMYMNFMVYASVCRSSERMGNVGNAGRLDRVGVLDRLRSVVGCRILAGGPFRARRIFVLSAVISAATSPRVWFLCARLSDDIVVLFP